MRIIGPPRLFFPEVKVRSAGIAEPWFIDQVMPVLWAEAERLGIDAVGVWAQAIKECAGGRYDGAVDPRACNTCGLKIKYPGIYGPPTDGDEPAAHAQFATWQVGARAHVQHLCAYAGKPLPAGEVVVDPRYEWVKGRRCENWSELGGLWAPSPSYGAEIEALMLRLTRSG